ncbi:type 1 glutamine amidotransferase domain-containing protein [Flavisphingomonas formosensis]|uniref:type 1 glutamine amidotransferase domain-containing protein n=1 Tax=Flavisphingomonas formosensis TaxID=861534 RepID=UPI0012FBA718|nr:type 1 glutamine amidotransferase domain-containing protein [Sphingomonas formosensis]
MTAIADARILIIATDGFEDSELFGPRERLLSLGAKVVIASPGTDPIQGREHDEKTRTIAPDITLDQVDVAAFDALILPGGVINPDALRLNAEAIGLIRAFAESGKPLAAICHGPWLLVEADVIRGRTVTGWPSIRTDLRNAGGMVVDRAVAVDGNLITSRQPEDVPAFTDAVVARLEDREVAVEAA